MSYVELFKRATRTERPYPGVPGIRRGMVVFDTPLRALQRSPHARFPGRDPAAGRSATLSLPRDPGHTTTGGSTAWRRTRITAANAASRYNFILSKKENER